MARAAGARGGGAVRARPQPAGAVRRPAGHREPVKCVRFGAFVFLEVGSWVSFSRGCDSACKRNPGISPKENASCGCCRQRGQGSTFEHGAWSRRRNGGKLVSSVPNGLSDAERQPGCSCKKCKCRFHIESPTHTKAFSHNPTPGSNQSHSHCWFIEFIFCPRLPRSTPNRVQLPTLQAAQSSSWW